MPCARPRSPSIAEPQSLPGATPHSKLTARYPDHRIECRLRTALPVEPQRVVRPSRHGPAVEPGIPVRHTPEGHTAHVPGVAPITTEQTHVALRQGPLHR